MSCNGCRVLRKGCSDSCILRPCLQWIESADAQGHATVFVAKFFGRAGLMGFISAVPENQRPALFQSLLYEACGRTVNPVFGAVGLLWAGNWPICQAAVETVLKGGSLRPPSPSALSSPFFSSLPPGPSLPFLPGLDKAVAAKAREGPSPSPLYAPPVEPVSEFSKARLGVVLNQEKVHKADGYERREFAAAVGPRDRKGSNRQQPEWQQQQQPQLQRMVRGVVPHVHAWPEAAKFAVTPDSAMYMTMEKRERESPVDAYGLQVLAPVPRRVKPCLAAAHYTHDPMTRGSLYDDQDTVVGSNEQLDLGLTLKVKDTKGGYVAGLKRVYSPSCESVNSEGSVTSLDTTPRPVQPPSLSLQMVTGDTPRLHRKLLPLLL